jgi:competence protein ComEC
MAIDKRKQKLQVLKKIVIAILMVIVAIFLIRYYFKHYYVVESVNTPIVWDDDEIPTEEDDESSNDENETSNVEGTLYVHMIDCGQGDCFLFEQNGKFGMIDCGTRSSAKDVVYYLQKQGVSKLQFIVGTHQHDDHIGGMYDVLNSFKCEKVYLPDENGLATSQWYMKLLNKIKEDNIKLVNPKVNTKFKLGDAVFRVVGQLSSETAGTNLNEYSTVIKVSFGEMDILMTGDAESKAEEAMLANSKVSLQCEILKLGHHGSDTSTRQKFLEKVDPDYGLISCEVGNTYKHPSTETMKNLKKRKVKVYRTDEQGDIVLAVTSDSVSFNKKPGDYKDGVSLAKN